MKASSAKAKGRRLQQWVCHMISWATGHPWGKDECIASREMGQSGTDIRLVGSVRQVFPFSSECKWQETWDIPAWIRRAEANLENDMRGWLLFVKKNRMDTVVVMDAWMFFDIWRIHLANSHYQYSTGEKKSVQGHQYEKQRGT